MKPVEWQETTPGGVLLCALYSPKNSSHSDTASNVLLAKPPLTVELI